MFRSGDRFCDTLQWKNALCVLENFCEDRLHNRILSQQEVALIQSDLILCNLLWQQNPDAEIKIFTKILLYTTPGGGGGALGYFLGGYVPPGTPNWHPVLKKIPLKLIPCSRNGPIFYTPF